MGVLQIRESQITRTSGLTSGPNVRGPYAVAGGVGQVMLAAAVAMALVLLATPHGIGVSPDSTQYLSAAQHLANGDGLRAHWWDEGAQPFIHFPPGLPAAISVLTQLRMSPTAAAMTLNTAALFATALLTFLLGRQAARGSTFAGLAAAGAVLLSSDILAAHAMLWSEPLFIALTLGALLSIVHATDSHGNSSLVTAAVLAGVAGLVRYAVPPVILAGALALLLLGNKPWPKRLARSLIFFVIAALPLTLLLAATAVQESTAPRQLVFHPPGLDYLETAGRTMYYWLMPKGAPVAWRAVLLVAMAAAVIPLVRSTVRARAIRPGDGQVFRTRAAEVLVLFGVSYLAFLVFVHTVFDAQTTPGSRILAPLVPAVAIIVVAVLARAMQDDWRRRPALALGALMALALVWGTANWLQESRRVGLEYSGPEWRNSRLIDAVRALDRGTVVLSNHPGAILYHTGREVLGIPRLANPNSELPNTSFASQMATICAMAGTRSVAYVHFANVDQEWFLPSLLDSRRYWRSAPKVFAFDGVLDTIPPTCATRIPLAARPRP